MSLKTIAERECDQCKKKDTGDISKLGPNGISQAFDEWIELGTKGEGVTMNYSLFCSNGCARKFLLRRMESKLSK